MQKVNKANSSTNIFWKFFLFSVMAAKVNFNDGIITTELLNQKKKKKKMHEHNDQHMTGSSANFASNIKQI